MSTPHNIVIYPNNVIFILVFYKVLDKFDEAAILEELLKA
jgi:hypothetical protein